MRILRLFLVACAAVVVHGWEEQDIHIFKLNERVVSFKGRKDIDFYSLLGVSKDAPFKDIQQSFRSLSRKLHPDRNPGNKMAAEVRAPFGSCSLVSGHVFQGSGSHGTNDVTT